MSSFIILLRPGPGPGPLKNDPPPYPYHMAISRLDLGLEFVRQLALESGKSVIIVMVGFKNRYMVMEVLLDPKSPTPDDPIIITQFNISKAIKDSILVNFGDCGLASSLGSFQVKYVNPITKLCIIRASREDYQKVWSAITMLRTIGNCPLLFNLLDLSGSIKACKNAALKCDEFKFEQYKLVVGERLSADVTQHMQNCIEKIKILEH